MHKFSFNKKENGFIKVFKPLFIVQSVIGSMTVSFKDNLICPKFWYQRLYSCAFLIVCVTAAISFNSVLFSKHSNWSIEIFLEWSHLATSLFLSCSVIVINNFVNLKSNYKLFVILERIDEDLRITGNEKHYRVITRLNYGFVFIITILSVIRDIIIEFGNSGLGYMYLYVPTIVFLSVHDMEAFCFVGIIVYLIIRVKYINAMLCRMGEVKWRSLKHLESSVIIRKLFLGYRHILTAYCLIEKNYGHFVSILINYFVVTSHRII